MYQAIEAISKAGVIQPLEPVMFDENEHLLWAEVLKDSPHLNENPEAIQQTMRPEWD